MLICATPRRFFALCAVWSGALAAIPAFAQIDDADLAVRISNAPDGGIVATAGELAELAAATDGLLIWREGRRDRWARLPVDLSQLVPADTRKGTAELGARTRAAGPSLEVGFAASTAPLPQFAASTLVRATPDSPILTPADQEKLLDGTPTFRRRPLDDGTLPELKFEVKRLRKTVAQVVFEEKERTAPWAHVAISSPEGNAGASRDVVAGLPPGEYTLVCEGYAPTHFEVARTEASALTLGHSDQLREALGDQGAATIALLVVESIDRRSHPTEALDAIEKLSAVERPAYLVKLEQDIYAQLVSKTNEPPIAEATGIDEVRESIAVGAWSAASETLEAIVPRDDAEAALVHLYRGVLASELSSDSEVAEAAFSDAMAKLDGSNPELEGRVLANYANHKIRGAVDRIHNQAFQIASGEESPTLAAAIDWIEASELHRAACELAQAPSPEHRAAAAVNRARLYASLADLIRVLDVPDESGRRFIELERAALAQARDSAEGALDEAEAAELSSAIAAEILAQLALRSGDPEQAARSAEISLKRYLDAGSVLGAESAHRALGLIAAEKGDDEEALRQFRASHALSEFARSRLPLGDSGRSRGGHLARRAYVSERLVDLHFRRGEFLSALKYVESAKARSLQDVLEAQADASRSSSPESGIDAILAQWPEGVVALEYFLTSESAYVFLVESGNVRGWRLGEGNPHGEDPTALVRDVTGFLAGIQKTAARMGKQRTYDPAWQHDLHAFYRRLIPPEAMEAMRGAETVIVVPHHVLHYFPFAALVTEIDDRRLKSKDVPQPKFLVEEDFSICLSPSLRTWDRLRRSGTNRFAEARAIGVAEFRRQAPLPGAKADLGNLASAFGPRLVNTLRGEEADEANMLDFLKRRGFLFLATHGSNVPECPLDSHLFCRTAEGDDGKITARRLFDADIGADVVVMSACFTGLADRSPLPGDDMYGLERAFLNGGVDGVISGRWDVHDYVGPMVMDHFFRRVVEGRPVHQALAEAQRDLLRECRERGPGDLRIHPYFWAVFSFAGCDLVQMDTASEVAERKPE